MSPRPQAPEGEAPKQDPPVDWRVRSQGLEEALRELGEAAMNAVMDAISYMDQDTARRYIELGTYKAFKAALSLGLPDEEGEDEDDEVSLCPACDFPLKTTESICPECGDAPGPSVRDVSGEGKR